MARQRGNYSQGERVSFRIGKGADKETLDFINSLQNFSEEVYIMVRDTAKLNKLKRLVEEHEKKFHKKE